MTLTQVLALIRKDETAPRVTFYDDEPGPTRGERIELSAKVVANWVAKAGNLLQDEFDAGPGTTVGLDLPVPHWRTLYWALAAWSVGATVQPTDPATADVVVTDDPNAEATRDLVVVTLAALARMCPNPLPSGAIDEAAELATYPDRLDPWAQPEPEDVAIVSGDERVTYADLVPDPAGPAAPRVLLESTDAITLLRDVLTVWAANGSVLLIRDPDPTTLADRLRAEGATRQSGDGL